MVGGLEAGDQGGGRSGGKCWCGEMLQVQKGLVVNACSCGGRDL